MAATLSAAAAHRRIRSPLAYVRLTQHLSVDWLLAAARRQDRLRNPAGHWIDYCKRRAQQEGG